MTGRTSRNKGARGELEVQAILIEHGYKNVTRGFASGASGGGDLVGGPHGWHWEVKRTETTRPWDWISQANEAKAEHEVPVVAFRRSRSDWHAIMPLDELVRLIKKAEQA